MKHTTASWAKRASSFAIVMALATMVTGQASARILFQDDIFSEDYSQGFMFNADDAGDEDVTLQLGNDGTDGTIIWDDGTSTLNIGDGVGSTSIDSNTWDISAAGVGSGFTGFTSTGRVDFTGATNGLGIPNGAANPASCTIGDIFLNNTDNMLYSCIALNTWNAIGPGANPQDFESVYAEDTDNTLTANADFTIDAVGAVAIDSEAGLTAGGQGVILTSDGGAAGTFDIVAGGAFALDAATAEITTATDLTLTNGNWDLTLPSTGVVANINAFTSTGTANEGANLVGLEDAGNNFNATTVEGALAELGLNKTDTSLTFIPEFEGATYDGGRGKLISEKDNSLPNAYHWTTRTGGLESMIISKRFEIPDNFNAIPGSTTTQSLDINYKTGLATNADNEVEVSLLNITDGTTCGSVTNLTNIAWTNNTDLNNAVISAGCIPDNQNPGDIMEVQITLTSNNTAGAEASIGNITYTYVN